MLWCEHCGGRASTRLDGNFFICCSNCGKVLLDLHEPALVKNPRTLTRDRNRYWVRKLLQKQTNKFYSSSIFHAQKKDPNLKPITHEGYATGQKSVTIGACMNQT